jgi:hypothetical protein
MTIFRQSKLCNYEGSVRRCGYREKTFGVPLARDYRESNLCDYNCFDFVVADPWSAKKYNCSHRAVLCQK